MVLVPTKTHSGFGDATAHGCGVLSECLHMMMLMVLVVVRIAIRVVASRVVMLFVQEMEIEAKDSCPNLSLREMIREIKGRKKHATCSLQRKIERT